MPKSRLEQTVDARLGQIKDAFDAHRGLTGKAKRDASGAVVGRFKGSLAGFPELRHSGYAPGRIADAIGRGKGIIYRRIRADVRRDLAPDFPKERRRYPERPTIAPHQKLTKRCKLCGKMHGRGEHRFHGEGSFHSTHLFGFNPESIGQERARAVEQFRKRTGATLRQALAWLETFGYDVERAALAFERARRAMQKRPKENPSGVVPIYGGVVSVVARKGRGHQCSRACARSNHTYIHKFTSRPPMFGSPDRQTLMIGKPLGGRMAANPQGGPVRRRFSARRNPLIQLPDGRTFPEFEGQPLSWSIGLYMTTAEERAGFPRARAVLAAMPKERIQREHSEALRASFDRMFGHNARIELKMIEEEMRRRGIRSSSEEFFGR